MKILVTGGNGFIGKRLSKLLLKGKDTIYIFDREADSELEKAGAKYYIGDVTKLGDVLQAFEKLKPDIVYHLAGITDEQNQNLYGVNVDGTKNVVAAAKGKSIKQIVFPGTVGILSTAHQPTTELEEYYPQTPYEETKVLSEKEVIYSGIPYTVVRAPVVIGPNVYWKNIIKAAKEDYPLIGTGANYWPLVDVDDFSEALFFVKDNKHALNQIYNITAKNQMTYGEIYREIRKQIGKGEITKTVPVWLIYILSFVYSLKCKLKGVQPKLSMQKQSIDRLLKDRRMDVSKIEKLGFAPKYTIQESIARWAPELK
ncbi:MAG: NAD(P)-dependent oxidoreductase [Candidatus Diapherotrites archaeon]|nr:NAD(P)-dependent oxidoreductase [Candidatus Diapherotrites archaeon]